MNLKTLKSSEIEIRFSSLWHVTEKVFSNGKADKKNRHDSTDLSPKLRMPMPPADEGQYCCLSQLGVPAPAVLKTGN